MTSAAQEIHPSFIQPIDAASEVESHSRVLIVDDDESIQTLFAVCLGERYACATAGNAKEALEALAREDFALVITDVQMPGLSGIELLRQIIARYPDTAVILVSGVDRSQRVLDAMRLGASDYLIKPCDLDVLELSVERALAHRALVISARRYKRDLEIRNTELARRQSELQRLQAQIIHSEKMASLGELAAGVAHELNNPAGFIYGNMEMLDECATSLERLLGFYDRTPLPAEAVAQAGALKREINYQETLDDMRSIIKDCRDGAERIRDIVQNLRIFSRLDEAEFKKVDLHEGLDSTIRLLARHFSADGITLSRDYGEVPPVDCYGGQLNQVWVNLLGNAAHAVGSKGGEVRVQTRLEDEMVMVRVSDTGCGIAPEHLKKIFDPFFTTKPVGDGTGLGLSITYSIIERHGGSIKVESAQGQGTTFSVAIPVNAKRHEAFEIGPSSSAAFERLHLSLTTSIEPER